MSKLESIGIEVVHVETQDIERVEGCGYRPVKGEGKWPCDVWRVTLTYQGRTLTTSYRTGIGHRGPGHARGFYGLAKNVRITAKDVLESLFSDASCGSETFEEFCSSMDMSTDSRKALDTYLACQKAGTELRTLLRTDFVALQDEVNS